jgi:hypothetical protein
MLASYLQALRDFFDSCEIFSKLKKFNFHCLFFIDFRSFFIDYRLFFIDYLLFFIDYRLFFIDYLLFFIDYRLFFIDFFYSLLIIFYSSLQAKATLSVSFFSHYRFERFRHRTFLSEIFAH